MEPVFVLTIRHCRRDDLGLFVSPGLSVSELQFRPELGKLIQGEALELRFPDETVVRARLLSYGIPAQRLPDGRVLVDTDPEVHLTLDCLLAPEEVPAGTELWWLCTSPQKCS